MTEPPPQEEGPPGVPDNGTAADVDATETAVEDEPACRYCKADINADAWICSECDRWQMPMGWLASQVSLGDVALYGSLVVVVWSTFNIAIWGERARLGTTHLSCGSYAAEVYIANTGTSRGIFVSATAAPVIGSDTAEAVAATVTRVGASGGHPVLAEGEGDIFRLEVPPNQWSAFDSRMTLNDCHVALDVRIIDRPDGGTDDIDMPRSCTCSDFRS